MTRHVPAIFCACSLNRRPRASRGFSLTELVVVIAILSILVGISVAALSRAQRARSNARCASNLRSIGLAFQSYTTDNDDHYPQPALAAQWEDLLRRYIPGSTFCCPADAEIYPKTARSYDWRDMGESSSSLAGRRTTEVVRDGVSLSYDTLQGWHDVRKVQVVFTDASVHMLDDEVWLKELQLPVVSGP
jgi:prepilin-type N-terminal cleavage/methylation domain-containing protein